MTREKEIRLAGAALDRRRHVCAFFHGKDEEYQALLPFLKDGIDDRQKVVNIIEGSYRTEHLRRLAQGHIDTAQAEQTGQLEVHTWQDAYLKGGRFDQHAMLVLVEDLLAASRRQGYPLARLTANMEWALEDLPGVEDLVEYECTVNNVLAKYDDAVVWIYDCAKFGAGVMLDILRTHPMAIIGGVLKENSFYVPPEEFLTELRDRRGDGIQRREA